MIESAACRLTVEDGSDLIDTFAKDLAADRGWVLASGAVEDVELRVVAGNSTAVRVMSGWSTLVTLSGPVGGPYQAMVARDGERGLEVIAGRLLRARARGVHAAWIPFAAPVVRSVAGPSSPPEQRPVEPPGGVSGWAVAAAAAAAAEVAREMDGQESQERPAAGDLVQHFKFGLCDVLKTNGDTLTIRDVKGSAHIHHIRIDLLTVLAPGERDGKRLFKLVRKR